MEGMILEMEGGGGEVNEGRNEIRSVWYSSDR